MTTRRADQIIIHEGREYVRVDDGIHVWYMWRHDGILESPPEGITTRDIATDDPEHDGSRYTMAYRRRKQQ